jgi:hypothetical protein
VLVSFLIYKDKSLFQLTVLEVSVHLWQGRTSCAPPGGVEREMGWGKEKEKKRERNGKQGKSSGISFNTC